LEGVLKGGSWVERDEEGKERERLHSGGRENCSVGNEGYAIEMKER
jgi:hypothetical protein